MLLERFIIIVETEIEEILETDALGLVGFAARIVGVAGELNENQN